MIRTPSRAALTALTASLLVACAAPRGGDPLPFVPAEADNVLIAPSIADLQKNASTFLAGVEGTSGLLELAADRFGLDLRTADGPDRLGLDATRGLALYTILTTAPSATTPGDMVSSPALVIALPVARPDTFCEALALRLTRSAGLTPSTPTSSDDAPRAFTSKATTVVVGLVDTPEGQVGLLHISQVSPVSAEVPAQVPPTDPLAAWRAAATRPTTPFIGSPRDRAAPNATLRFAWRFTPPPTPDGLGLLRGLVDNIAERLSAWEGSLTLDADRLAIEMTTARPPADATPLPVAWVNPEDPKPSKLAAVFPRTSTAVLRFRINLDKVRAVPGFIRNNVVPDQLPGLESFPLPATSDLINLLDGDLAVAFLGLAPETRLAELSSRASLNRLPDVARLALAAGLRDAAGFQRTYAAIADQLATSGWIVAPIPRSQGRDTQGWSGWTFKAPSREHNGRTFEGRSYTLLHDDAVAVFLVGHGEADAFMAVREGRALPLSSFATAPASAQGPQASAPSPGAARALGHESTTSFLGLTVSPVRLTRELAARSVPPYFLKIINDIRLFAGDLAATPDGVTLHLELDL